MSEANLDRVSQLEVPQEQGASKKTIRKVMFASISEPLLNGMTIRYTALQQGW